MALKDKNHKKLLYDLLTHPEIAAYFLFVTFAIHPKKNKIEWTVDAKLKKGMPTALEDALTMIMPFNSKKDAKDGRWVLYWKGFNKL